ncbi:Efflux pump patC [Metarhizium anisopliae]
MFYVSVCAPKDEMQKAPARVSTMSASWAIGLIIGGPIGSAFSERVTWRWAFLLNLPCVGATIILAYFCVPETRFLPDENDSILRRLRRLDWAPILLNIAMPVLFALALTFSGSVWHWDSRPVLGVWLSFGLVSLLWVLYLWSNVEWSGLLLHTRTQLSMWALLAGSACAGASYAISLYFFPLYFAFAKGADALEQTLWVLPFVLAFIASVAATGRLLHIAGFYRAIYAAVLVAAGVALAVILTPETPRAQVAGLEALVGIGVGLLFQHSIGICNALERSKDKRKRLDSIFMCNFAQMGGIPMTLAASWGIFQNVGYRLLAQSLGSTLNEIQIRQLLAGSSTNTQNGALLRKGADIVCIVIAREFYIVAAAGGVSVMVGLLFLVCTWREKIDFSNPVEAGESVEVVENTS